MTPAIFLSASVPSRNQVEFFEMGVRPRTIESAVTALTAAVLARGWHLVFGGHPAISPMVALATLQRYRPDRKSEPPIVIYQAEPYRTVLPDETWALFKTGVAKIVWTPAIDGEVFKTGAGSLQTPKSLERMRLMLMENEHPVAMFCIGGMKGVVDEFQMFRRMRPGHPVIVLAGTGGASRQLAEADRGDIVVPDRDALTDEERGDPREPLPYPYLLEQIVQRLPL
jgi:SLOG cluster3 family